MNKILANGVRLNYEIRGSGPKLLFIHGIGADMKNPIGLFNSPMINHFTILSYDPRGLGESDSPESGCSMGDLAEDAAALAKAVGWEKYHVFGASMGGMVAQELAVRHADAVDKLVLAVTHSGGDGAPVVVDKMLDLPPIEILKLSDTRQDEKWVEGHPEIIEKVAAQTNITKTAMETNPSFRRGYMNQVAAVLGHDASERLKEIKADTLVFNGRYDGSNPLSNAEKIAKSIPNARFEVVEHGHGSWFFDPKVWDMVIDFYHER